MTCNMSYVHTLWILGEMSGDFYNPSTPVCLFKVFQMPNVYVQNEWIFITSLLRLFLYIFFRPLSRPVKHDDAFFIELHHRGLFDQRYHFFLSFGKLGPWALRMEMRLIFGVTAKHVGAKIPKCFVILKPTLFKFEWPLIDFPNLSQKSQDE